jgi:hypothetical protein
MSLIVVNPVERGTWDLCSISLHLVHNIIEGFAN